MAAAIATTCLAAACTASLAEAVVAVDAFAECHCLHVQCVEGQRLQLAVSAPMLGALDLVAAVSALVLLDLAYPPQ